VWLNEIGIRIGYNRLSYYICQLRRAEQPPTSPHAPEPVPDPLAQLNEREQRRPGFQYNADPDPTKLI